MSARTIAVGRAAGCALRFWIAFVAMCGLMLLLAACAPESKTSAFQEAIIKDGVTDAEYRAAVDKTIECFREGGVIVNFTPSPNGVGGGFSGTGCG